MSTTNKQYARWMPFTDLNAELLTPGSVSISVGDLLYWDASSHVAKPASSLADLGTKALMQASFAKLFVGVSNAQALASDATQRPHPVLIDQIIDMPCASGTFEPGDYVGPDYASNALLDQQVVKVSFPFLAVGRVVKRYSSATTTVKVRVMSRYLLGPLDRFAMLGSGQGQGVTTLTDAAQTLTVDTNPILNMVPTAARNVTLPNEAASAGLEFQFTNNSAGANTVTFLASGGGGIKGNGACPQNKTALLWCDGTNWNGLISA